MFSVLTGAPSQHFSTRKFKETNEIKNTKWRELKEYYFNNYLICCSTHSEYFYEKYNEKELNSELQEHINVIEELSNLGLVTNHAYSVLLCHEEEIEGEIVKLV